MPKARIIDESDEDTDRQRQAEELAELNDAEGGELFSSIEELRDAQGVMIQITRIAPVGKTGYMGQMSPIQFSRETMRRLYGAGMYKVRVKGPKGYLPGGGAVEIGELVESEPKNGGSDFLTMMEFMDKRERDRKAESSEKTSRILELAIPTLGTVLAALLSRNSSPDIAALVTAMRPAPGPSLADLSTAMVNMRSLTQDNTPRLDPMDQILKVMDAVKDLGDKGGGSKGETNWLDIAKELIGQVGPAVAPILQGLQARQALTEAQKPKIVSVAPVPVVASAPAIVPPGVVSAESPAATSVVNASEPDMLVAFLPVIKSYLSEILVWAKDDKNPQTYAEVLIDKLPSNIANFIPQEKALEYLNHEKWFEYVCEQNEGFKNLRPWCDEFRLELIELLKPQEEIESSIDQETNSISE